MRLCEGVSVTSHRPSSETSVDEHAMPPIETFVPFVKAATLARRAMRVEPTSVSVKGVDEEVFDREIAIAPHTLC